MEGLFFNIDNGYIEGVVRGYKNSLITSSQYINLTQCDNLQDLKLQLSATDYSSYLSDVSDASISTSVIERRLNTKLIDDFNYIKSQSAYPLNKFLDFISYNYMIDNILLILTGTLNNKDKNEILRKCNPLGWFETLPTLSIAADLSTLYETVLIDTPLSKYFNNVLSISDLNDLNIEIVRNILYKEYLEDFYSFCEKELPNPTSEIMKRLISFEADKRTINICFNSLETDLTVDDKMKMLPNVGTLTSDASIKFSLCELNDYENLRAFISSINGRYKEFFVEGASSSDDKSLEDKFYEFEMALNRDAFTQQFTYSTIWAFIKSKEQEIRNISWISECIAQNQRDKINNYISVY